MDDYMFLYKNKNKLKISVDDAINELKKYRKSINPNRGFIKQLREYSVP